MEKQAMLPSALSICVAVQAGQLEQATAGLPALQTELAAAIPAVQLATLKNILSLAVRKRQQGFFKEVLTNYQEILMTFMTQAELNQADEDFLQFLVYTLCDQRLMGEAKLVQQLVEAWTKTQDMTVLWRFWNEWSSLIARMVRRRWLGESTWLLTVMLRQLWRKQDAKLVQVILWQLQMHLTMNARVADLETTFIFYKPLFYSFLFIVDTCEPREGLSERQQAWLQLVLRSMRDLVSQLARGQMLEQQEIYHSLAEQWLWVIKGEVPEPSEEELPIWRRPAPASHKLEQRARRFLQLAITYWCLTNPKSSKRQMEDLADLLEPRLVTPEWKKLLQKIS